MESVALQNFECLKKVSDPSFSIARTGVYLCEEHSFLAASPDAIATDSHGTAVVEVKCPKKYSTFLISDAPKTWILHCNTTRRLKSITSRRHTHIITKYSCKCT